jgi:hypothetical protein
VFYHHKNDLRAFKIDYDIDFKIDFENGFESNFTLEKLFRAYIIESQKLLRAYVEFQK